MTEQINNQLVSDNHPLALDTWSPTKGMRTMRSTNRISEPYEIGLSSFDYAREAIESAVANAECDLNRPLALQALLSTVTIQALRNNLFPVPPEILASHPDAANGDGDQATMVDMLHTYPSEIVALEIARRTHIGEWNVQQQTDIPVRMSLDTVPDTERLNTKPRYKIKLFHDEGAMIERKRDIRSHFGGTILTRIRNCMLIDYYSDEIPPELFDYMLGEQRKATKRDEMAKEYDYEKESVVLNSELEKYVAGRLSISESEKPRWVVPLLTTYYSYHVDAHKETQRKSESARLTS